MLRRCIVASAQDRVRVYPRPVALDEHRRRLLGRAYGRVLDLSLRPDANRNCLSADVAELTVVTGGPAPAQLWMSAPGGGRPTPGAARAVRLMTGVLRADSFEPGSFDTVVSIMTMCTVDLPDAMLCAVARWLTPGGQLLVLEHVGGTGLIGLAQGLFGPFERALAAGCHLDRDIAAGCRAADLDLTDGTRFSSRVAGGLSVPFFSGVARPRSRHRLHARHAIPCLATPPPEDPATP